MQMFSSKTVQCFFYKLQTTALAASPPAHVVSTCVFLQYHTHSMSMCALSTRAHMFTLSNGVLVCRIFGGRANAVIGQLVWRRGLMDRSVVG